MKATLRIAALTLMLAASPHASAAGSFLFAGTGSSGISQDLVLGLSNGSTVTLTTGQGLFTAGTLNQGWWGFDNANFDANDSIYVGALQPDPLDPIWLHRNFFTFSLANITPGSIISAALRINDVGIGSSTFPMTYSLFDVTTDARTLNANSGTSSSIYDDLGSGRRYAEQVVTGQLSGGYEIGLNGDALADLNAAAGRFFSIGGTLDMPVSVVSEPPLLALLGAGLAAAGLGRRRRVSRADLRSAPPELSHAPA
ncbi:hypothetical protein [Zoogloea dura]|uniref:PEP-CTERM sorting domain-containing protein n=1 Tax=Zoogloea dura TaxID=2728840 RepID=A0A848G7J1_9RHOO|nr:hypothetical protein [Zoogloea dura]NML28238.1 hypothetical protein [Zoogloea dura]